MTTLIHPWHAATYTAFIAREVLFGALRVARAAVSPGEPITPAIVEFPLRAATDFEVSTLASSITITPGTLVVGVAAATPTEPVTLFVHCVFDADRASILDGLHDMETRMLRMSRGPRNVPPVGRIPTRSAATEGGAS